MKSKILMCIDWYYPAFKAGGPIQSVKRLALALSRDFDIYILTSAYDLDDTIELVGIKTNKWIIVEKGIQVFYTTRLNHSVQLVKDILLDLLPMAIYFYSPFSKLRTIDVVRAGFSAGLKTKYILAPRGTLKSSALQKSNWKKRLYFRLIKASGIHHKFQFHATNPVEKSEIVKIFGRSDIYVIDNLPPEIVLKSKSIAKSIGSIRLILIGRIHPIKNVLFVLELIKSGKKNIELTIVGGKEDLDYYSSCLESISKLPTNVQVEIHEGIPHDQIESLIENHHMMVLPTLGENYGSVIIESLAVGRPVLISDQTPWKNLKEYHAGWELPLSDKQAWTNAIEDAASWDQAEFSKHCEGALAYAKAHTNNEDLVKKYVEMFGGGDH